jgi:Polyphosphate kinase 2 (PPK2)
LWRAARALPERDRIGIFNRSRYEEVLIVGVIPNSYAPKVFRTKRSTTRRSGAIAIDRSVTSRRICTATARASSSSFSIFPKKSSANASLPVSKSRIKTGNSAARTSKKGNWDDYMDAYEACLSATSMTNRPWYIVPADDKKNTRLIISRIILDTLRSLKMKYPTLSEKQRKELRALRRLLAR